MKSGSVVMACLLWVVLLGWVPGMAPSARARGRRITVFMGSRDESKRSFALRGQESMRHALSRMEECEIVWVHEAVDSGGLGPQTRRIEEGKELLARAIAAYGLGQASQATALARQALRAFEEGLDALDDPNPLVQVHQLLAASLHAEGKTGEADDWFGRAISLGPGTPMDPTVFPREIREVHAERSTKLLETKARIKVRSEPPGAAIYLDGRLVGIAPAKLRVKVAGPHLVRLVSDGYQPRAAVVDLQAGRAVELSRELEPVRQADALRKLIEQAMREAGLEELTADDAILSLGEILDVDELVLIRVLSTTERQVILEGFHYDFLDGQLINLGDRLITPGAKKVRKDLTRFVDDLISSRTTMSLAGTISLLPIPPQSSYTGIVIPGAGQEEGLAAGGEGRSLVASPWLWVGVGGAAAVAAGTAAVLLAAPSEEPASKPSEGRLLFGFE